MSIQNVGKLGSILLDVDVITKRQLSKAIQLQLGGDTRKLGAILVELEYCSLDEITDAVLGTDHEERDVIEVDTQPVEISEEKVLRTKFTLSGQTIIAAGIGLSSLIGMWYALQSDIQEAKELPTVESLYQNEYPSRPAGYNWPRSYEQYKDQVGTLQEDMDDVFENLEKLQEEVDDLEKQVTDLRIKVGN